MCASKHARVPTTLLSVLLATCCKRSLHAGLGMGGHQRQGCVCKAPTRRHN